MGSPIVKLTPQSEGLKTLGGSQGTVSGSGKPPIITFVEPETSLRYVRILIIGEQGSGKTRLASSILDVERVEGVLYIDTDRGISSGAQYIERHRNKIHIRQISQDNPIKDMTETIRWLRFATNRDKAAEHGLPYIDTVVIDTLSFLGKRTIGKLGEGAKSVETGVVPSNNQMASQADWNFNQAFIEGWVDQINGLPCHHIATCHMHLERNERKQTWMPVLILPGKLGRAIPSYYRQVHWLSVEQPPVNPQKPDEKLLPKHVLLCRPEGDKTDGLREAKDCSDTLPYTMDNPTMEELFAYFFKQKTAK